MAGHAFSAIPTDDLFRFPAQFFRVLLLRRLWLPLPLSSRTCRCGRLLDVIRGDGRPSAGVTITEAARKKRVVTYLELIGTGGRTRLVVLAAEVGGQWSQEALSFVSQLARAKARSEPRILAVRAQQAWHHRWCSLLACAA